jgi:hypothetical protein
MWNVDYCHAAMRKVVTCRKQASRMAPLGSYGPMGTARNRCCALNVPATSALPTSAPTAIANVAINHRASQSYSSSKTNLNVKLAISQFAWAT